MRSNEPREGSASSLSPSSSQGSSSIMIVRLIQKPDKPVNFVSGVLAELADRSEELLRRDAGWKVKRALGLLSGRRGRAIVGISLGHGHSLAWVRAGCGVASTAPARYIGND